MTFKSPWLDWKAGSVSNVSDSPSYTQEFCHTKIDTQKVSSHDKTTEVYVGKALTKLTELPEVRIQGTDRTDKTSELTFYEDPGERWFQDSDGRFWYLDRLTGQRTELIPGNQPASEPLPRAFFEAFGTLLGMLVKRQIQ